MNRWTHGQLYNALKTAECHQAARAITQLTADDVDLSLEALSEALDEVRKFAAENKRDVKLTGGHARLLQRAVELKGLLSRLKHCWDDYSAGRAA